MAVDSGYTRGITAMSPKNFEMNQIHTSVKFVMLRNSHDSLFLKKFGGLFGQMCTTMRNTQAAVPWFGHYAKIASQP